MSSVNLKRAVCLSISVIVNLICLVLIICSRRNEKLSWTREAATAAENVASFSCSGHGRAYLDGLVTDNGRPICECNACFTGPDCSVFIPNCTVDADSGNPMFLEPFWKQNAGSSCIMVAGWHRMGYEFEDGSLISKELENVIHKLHDTVGNANTSNKYIIFGAGSTQLLNAAVYALSRTIYSSSPSSPTKVVTSAPYYPVYKSQTELLDSKQYKFSGDTSSWKNKTRSNNFIEFVTCPNNPDGHLNKAVLQGKFARHVYDLAYYWPHYTPIPAPMDEDLMLFTLSKLTGHAGSRFGWAIVKDKAVYERMVEYIDLNTYGVPRETQLRALKLLNVVLQGDRREMFRFAHTTMKSRWEKLTNILSTSKRFSMEKIPSQHCAFSRQVRAPSPAFAWLKCEAEEDKDCYNLLRAAYILGRKGAVFGVENRYVRISVVNSQDDFNLLQQRLQDLVSKERSIIEVVTSL
ncbi:tryptophan aminotransferase-related protein 4-like [Lycium ferocissimum]|uniref:tryptophan aminotransferase-related protein 4-like n=1 Tax=Lycium ferocissimum TaxID=112874 RepID=UPI0028151023|nr:tryptophan aminotransferase-related protein 4-like [Lycium ferocissimum]